VPPALPIRSLPFDLRQTAPPSEIIRLERPGSLTLSGGAADKTETACWSPQPTTGNIRCSIDALSTWNRRTQEQSDVDLETLPNGRGLLPATDGGRTGRKAFAGPPATHELR